MLISRFGAAAGVLLLGALIACGEPENPESTNSDETPDAPATVAAVEEPSEPTIPCEVDPLKSHEENLIDDFMTGNQFPMDVTGEPYEGNAEGDTIMVVYKAYGCGACAYWANTVDPLLTERYADDGLRVVSRHFPLQLGCVAKAADGPDAGDHIAAMAAEAARRQQMFKLMSHALFDSLGDSRNEEESPFTRDRIDELAESIGLDMEKYKSFMDSPEAKTWLDAHLEEACGYVDKDNEAVISGTPAVFLDGYKLNSKAWGTGRPEVRVPMFIEAYLKQKKLRKCREDFEALQATEPESANGEDAEQPTETSESA